MFRIACSCRRGLVVRHGERSGAEGDLRLLHAGQVLAAFSTSRRTRGNSGSRARSSGASSSHSSSRGGVARTCGAARPGQDRVASGTASPAADRGRSSSRMPFRITSRTLASCTSIPPARNAWQVRTPASSASTTAHGEGDVLPHHAHDPPAEADRPRHPFDAVRHQGDVCHLHGHLRAGPSHGDGHVGGGQGRRVVDAVAHHGDHPALRLQRLDGGHLLLGLQPGPHLVDAQLRRDPAVTARLSPVSMTVCGVRRPAFGPRPRPARPAGWDR